MLTATKGTAVLNTIFREYAPWCGDILTRENGSLVGHETGQARPHRPLPSKWRMCPTRRAARLII
jgi:predicted membrane GTPase involved in stress response